VDKVIRLYREAILKWLKDKEDIAFTKEKYSLISLVCREKMGHNIRIDIIYSLNQPQNMSFKIRGNA